VAQSQDATRTLNPWRCECRARKGSNAYGSSNATPRVNPAAPANSTRPTNACTNSPPTRLEAQLETRTIKTTQKRAALYARVSTARQAQGQSVDDQLQRLRTHALTQQYAVSDTNTYRDDGWSGQKLNRPGLDRLRDHAAQAAFDVILITNPDRLARKYIHQMLILEELERHGCAVEFIERPMSTDPHNQLLLQIRGAVAEYERTLIADRMRRGRLNKIKAGTLLPWTKLPFGYCSDPNQPRDPHGIRLEASQAVWVERIFAWYLEPEGTLHNVSQRLQAAGVRSPTGLSHWNVASVRWILKNPVYTGNAYANRTMFVPATIRQSALKTVGPGNSYRFRPKDEWIGLSTPAIITEGVFEQVQAKLGLNQRFAARNNTHYEYLLRGLVSCGECQLSATARTVSDGYGYYLCRGRADKARIVQGQRCRARFIPCDQLDALVWQDLSCVLLEPETIR
jgi:site-specific DNA recombinase